MKKATSLIAVAASALTLGVGSASAMSDTDTLAMGHSMVIGSLTNVLRTQGLPTDGIDKLTLAEANQLKQLLSSDDDMRSATVGQVRKILDTASAR